MLTKNQRKNKIEKCLLIIIGAFFILLSIGILGYKYCQKHHLQQVEEEKIEEFFEDISEETTIEEPIEEKIEKKQQEINYIAVIEIPKLNLKKGLVDRNSWRNNVNYNIQILKDSDMPNVDRGNFILAAHSGSSSVSYFRNLKQLGKTDEIYIYYNETKYTYRVVNKYDVEKTGKAEIIRNKNKTTLTLISCRHGTNYQIIVICELIESEKM